MIAAQPMFLDRPAMIESVSPAEYQWAESSLLHLLLDTASWLHARWDGRDRLVIGDLSSANGGALARHEAHREGLDADIAYLEKGTPRVGGHRAHAFHNRFRVVFVENGEVTGDFDRAKNYALLRHIAADRNVSQILVGCAIRQRLPAGFEKVVGYPGHDDHFHVRMLCSGCKGEMKRWNETKCKASSSGPLARLRSSSRRQSSPAR